MQTEACGHGAEGVERQGGKTAATWQHRWPAQSPVGDLARQEDAEVLGLQDYRARRRAVTVVAPSGVLGMALVATAHSAGCLIRPPRGGRCVHGSGAALARAWTHGVAGAWDFTTITSRTGAVTTGGSLANVVARFSAADGTLTAASASHNNGSVALTVSFAIIMSPCRLVSVERRNAAGTDGAIHAAVTVVNIADSVLPVGSIALIGAGSFSGVTFSNGITAGSLAAIAGANIISACMFIWDALTSHALARSAIGVPIGDIVTDAIAAVATIHAFPDAGVGIASAVAFVASAGIDIAALITLLVVASVTLLAQDTAVTVAVTTVISADGLVAGARLLIPGGTCASDQANLSFVASAGSEFAPTDGVLIVALAVIAALDSAVPVSASAVPHVWRARVAPVLAILALADSRFSTAARAMGLGRRGQGKLCVA